jgi:hypothetical protein
LVMLFIVVYSVAEDSYKRYAMDDIDRIREICKYPYFADCEELKMAAKYCRKANETYVKRCVY